MTLQRRTPLRRKVRPKPYRREPRRSGRVMDQAYLAWVHSLVCYVQIMRGRALGEALGKRTSEERAARIEDLHATDWSCWGGLTADHVGRRPLGRKSDDRDAIPLCQKHHMARQTYRGLWKGCRADEMREWCDEAITWTRRMWEQHQNPDKELQF